jgi:hypothetical protein
METNGPERGEEEGTGDSNDEVILAQEQDAINKPIHLGLFKEVTGTLILTNRRLIFACGDEDDEPLTHDTKGESLGQKIGKEAENLELDAWGMGGYLFYSEIEDLNKIPPNPNNLSIPISSITSISGEKGVVLGRPFLKVSWKDERSSENVKSTEFQEVLTGKERKKNLNDWAPIIEGLKEGTIKIQKLPKAPAKDTLEGKIAFVMGDMQEKGLSEIQQQVEERFKVDLDPDDCEEACKRLVANGFLEKEDGNDGLEIFYRKRSPIAIEDLSS